MLPKESRPELVDPRPTYQPPSLKQVTRVRRDGLFATDQVDRLPAPGDSLSEHLCHQLCMGSRDPRMLALANWLIWNLDPHGYLRDDLSELAAAAGADIADLEHALAIVQSLDPIGVGARSLQECLLLQLRAQADPDPVAIRLVEACLPALSEKRYDDIARTLAQSPERIMQALADIRRLEPRPGRAFGNAPTPTVRPDVAIEKLGDDYHVVMRDDEVPHVPGISRRWAEAGPAEDAARGHLPHQPHAAGRMLTAVERRRQTVRGVVQSIVRRQRGFLVHGPDHLRPLSLREVASDVSVHESTVSRTAAHRYVDTPHGVFPLRSFFTNRLPGDPAGLVSSLAARHRIRETVEAEDPSCPLADGQIARMLEMAGIRIARRTVVKYRELLGIARAPLRRSLNLTAHSASASG